MRPLLWGENMAIVPNSLIQLFGDVGLKPNQEDTIYFASENAKDTWFSSNSRPHLGNFSNQYYTRKSENVVRIAPAEVGGTIANVYNAQYMRFKNTAYENKWFYAFILSVDYVNDSVVDVHFALDIMMTWMGCFDFEPSFVVRQHVQNDLIGSNTVEENIDCGEYICERTEALEISKLDQQDNLINYKIGVWRTYDSQAEGIGWNPLRQGTYSPLMVNFYTMTSDGIDDLEELIERLTNQNRADEILAIKLVPGIATDLNGDAPITINHPVSKPYDNFVTSANTPKNNKLFTYPYKYLAVENCEGSSTVFKWEYFNSYPPSSNSQDCIFKLLASAVSPAVSITLIPQNYRRKTTDPANAITMNKFLSVAWNVDVYKAYLAQRDSTLPGEVLTAVTGGAIAGGGVGSMFPGPGTMAGATIGGIGAGLSTLASKGVFAQLFNQIAGVDEYIMPNQTKGNPDSDLLIQNKEKKFFFRKMCITPERMRVIDDYFTMYGYAIKRIQNPNMHARTRFTYLKTLGCNIKAKQGWSIPAYDATAIESMIDDGKRFWVSSVTVGDYTGGDNAIIRP